MDIPAHARIVYNTLPQKIQEEDLCEIVSHVHPVTHSVKGLNRTELNQTRRSLSDWHTHSTYPAVLFNCRAFLSDDYKNANVCVEKPSIKMTFSRDGKSREWTVLKFG